MRFMCTGLNGFAVCTQAGGLPPLLELMASRNGNLQHNAAFALYGLADNEDNIAAIVREGGVQCLQDCELLVQVTRPRCAALSCPVHCMHIARLQPLLISRAHSRAISVILYTGCTSHIHGDAWALQMDIFKAFKIHQSGKALQVMSTVLRAHVTNSHVATVVQRLCGTEAPRGLDSGQGFDTDPVTRALFCPHHEALKCL